MTDFIEVTAFGKKTLINIAHIESVTPYDKDGYNAVITIAVSVDCDYKTKETYEEIVDMIGNALR